MIVIHILWQLYLQLNHYFKVISIIWKPNGIYIIYMLLIQYFKYAQPSNNSPPESASIIPTHPPSISATQQASILPFISSTQPPIIAPSITLSIAPSKQPASALIDIPIVDSTCEATYNRTLQVIFYMHLFDSYTHIIKNTTHKSVFIQINLNQCGVILETIEIEESDIFGHLNLGFTPMRTIYIIWYYHIFLKETQQASMFTGPGVLVNALFSDPIIDIDGYNWSWSFSIMFGSIVSATNPVALLEELGVLKKLSTLIEAESLLNDCIAFVLFTLLKLYDTSFGGWFWGIFSGTICCFILSNEITITLSLLSLFSYTVDFVFHVNGVLIIVFMHLWVLKNKQAISPHVEEIMRHNRRNSDSVSTPTPSTNTTTPICEYFPPEIASLLSNNIQMGYYSNIPSQALVLLKSHSDFVREDMINHTNNKTDTYNDLSDDEDIELFDLKNDYMQYQMNNISQNTFNNIGNGASGIVRKVFHYKSCKIVAIKQCRSKQKHEIESFIRESKLYFEFEYCKNIINMLEYGKDINDNDLYIILEYMDLGSSTDKLKIYNINKKELIVAYIIKNVLNALNILHNKLYIHNDIKPQNILCNIYGKVKLSDFGTVLLQIFY